MSTYFVSSGHCQIGTTPENGWIESGGSPSRRMTVNEPVRPTYGITYHCSNDSYLVGPNINFCFRGKWTNEAPKCQKEPISIALNDSITNTLNTDKSPCEFPPFPKIRENVQSIRCTLAGMNVSCAGRATHYTVVSYICAEGYERDLSDRKNIRCSDGSWSNSWWDEHLCVPKCGEIPPLHISNGEVIQANVPWHVGIYKKDNDVYKLHCSGTVLTSSLVVSSFLCLYDPIEKRKYNKKQFKMVAGKSFPEYLADGDTETMQTYDIDFLSIRKVLRREHRTIWHQYF